MRSGVIIRLVIIAGIAVVVLVLIITLTSTPQNLVQDIPDTELLGSEGESLTGEQEATEEESPVLEIDAILARTSWVNYRSPNKEEVAEAKAAVACEISEGILSPTGKLPIYENYHWKKDEEGNYDFSQMKSLDWTIGFGSPIYAPFNGKVTYIHRTERNACGNRMLLEGEFGTISLCHVKDFVDEEGVYEQGREVVQGQVIGHSGGKCCLGQVPPNNWGTPCKAEGTLCTDPTKPEECQCQPVLEAGNSGGPHVHTTLKAGGNILSCLL